MLNFRFHIVSLVAVFMALAIGIIMGSTVIDRALVDTLEDQQQSLRQDLDEITEENEQLRTELDALRSAGERLGSEGGERLLTGTLDEVPVLVVAVRGVESSVLDDLNELLEVAGAGDQGTLWLTDRFALEEEAAVEDLAEVLDVPAPTPPDRLRALALGRIAAAVRSAVAPSDGQGEGDGMSLTPAPAPDDLATLVALREAGFVEYDAPEGGTDDVTDLAVPGTRIVLASGAGAEVADEDLAVPLARALVTQADVDAPGVLLLAAEAQASPDDEDEQDAPALVGTLREDDVGDRLSTVDNLDTFAGRLASVIALQDLGDGRRGHYGVGAGAQRLVPAPEG